MTRERFQEEAAKIGLALTDAQISAFEEFERRLYQANTIRNLTKISQEDCWIRHFLDSLLVAQWIPENSSVLDIGCGPGFPSWPLACARPDIMVKALDSSGKMVDFLHTVPLPNLEVIQIRAENYQQRDYFDVVTGRALAPLSIQLEISAPFAKIQGMILPLRTPSDRDEIQRLKKNPLYLKLESVFEADLAPIEARRIFPLFRKAGPTPKRFPRPWTNIKNSPL